jgi:hypothetical protein
MSLCKSGEKFEVFSGDVISPCFIDMVMNGRVCDVRVCKLIRSHQTQVLITPLCLYLLTVANFLAWRRIRIPNAPPQTMTRSQIFRLVTLSSVALFAVLRIIARSATGVGMMSETIADVLLILSMVSSGLPHRFLADVLFSCCVRPWHRSQLNGVGLNVIEFRKGLRAMWAHRGAYVALFTVLAVRLQADYSEYLAVQWAWSAV